MKASEYNNHSYVKEYLKVLINFFKSNPYASAKLFHGIATDAYHFKHCESKDNDENSASNNSCPWKSFYQKDGAQDTNTKVSWGVFLPERIR